jgi:putative peptidoglycan lipid II flippase
VVPAAPGNGTRRRPVPPGVTPARPSPLSLLAVGRSAAILTGGTIVAQLLNFAREFYLAATIGVSSDLDAFLIALVVPVTLAGALTTGASRALVPVYIEAADSRDAQRFAGNVMVWAGAAGLAIWVFVLQFADLTMTIAGPGLSVTAHDEAVGFLHTLAPLAFVSAIAAILYTVCQAEGRFGAIALSTIAIPAVTLVVMLAMWGELGLGALALGSLVGPIVGLLVLLLSTIRGSFVPIPVPRRDPRLGPFLRHAAPITLGTAILQLNVVGDRAIASLLGPGAVSTLRYAEVLVRTPISAIGPAWGLAIYPALVRAAVGVVSTSLASAVERTLHYVIAVFVPVATLTVAVAPLATSIAYQRGAFGAEQVRMTAESVAGFAPLILILMMLTVLTGAHNARKRGTLLMVGGILNVALNLTLDVLLGVWLGVPGIALASSIAQGVVMFLFLVRLRSRDGVQVRPLMRTLGLAFLSSAPISIVIGALVWGGLVPANTSFAVLLLGVLGLLGVFGYLVTARLAGMEEPRAISMLVTRRLVRRGPVAAED